MSLLSGELNLATVPAWLGQADKLAATEVLDLAGVTRIDSAGASLLLELSRRAQKQGRALAIINAHPQIGELLKFLELDKVLKLEA